MIKNLFRMQIACAFAILSVTNSAQADEVYTGFEASTFTATTIASNAGITSGPANNSFSVGGEGYTSPISYSTAFGSAGSASAAGFLAPELKGIATGFASEGVYNYAGMMATYQYDGATSGTVTYNWALDAVLTEPTDTAAFIRYNGALITEADFFSTSYTNFFESSATVWDSFSFTQGEAGTIDETGTLVFDADPGDVFYLVTGLQTYAGRAGAITDAFNTGTGSFSVSGGGSISSLSAVPEPTTASILALLGIAGIAVRRRQR